jgi:signal transduction histidine kinase
LLYFGFVTLIGGAGVAVMSRRSAAEKSAAESVARERDKLDSLVHAVEGVVWESGTDPATCAYVSSHAEELLGWPVVQWEQNPGLWQQHLHVEDREWAVARRQSAVEEGVPYVMEYRMLDHAGEAIWVRERGSVHQGTDGAVLRGVMSGISLEKQQAGELERIQRQLVEASRQAGMAEVATGVLHNVGNILNGVNISSNLITEAVRQSSLPHLKGVAEVLTTQADFPAFMAGPRGAAVPGFLGELHGKLEREQNIVNREVQTLRSSVEHIKDIVMMQQSYARMGGRSEPLDLAQLMDDALHINEAGLSRHHVQVIKDYQLAPPVQAERNKVLQILVNLIRNAKHALDDCHQGERIVTISIANGTDGLVNLTVADNGVGISAENMTRLFSYGFTTRRGGHGFGLHSSVNTAREMGGGLTASSAGVGLGAAFVLSIPASSAKPAVGKAKTSGIPAHTNK